MVRALHFNLFLVIIITQNFVVSFLYPYCPSECDTLFLRLCATPFQFHQHRVLINYPRRGNACSNIHSLIVCMRRSIMQSILDNDILLSGDSPLSYTHCYITPIIVYKLLDNYIILRWKIAQTAKCVEASIQTKVSMTPAALLYAFGYLL